VHDPAAKYVSTVLSVTVQSWLRHPAAGVLFENVAPGLTVNCQATGRTEHVPHRTLMSSLFLSQQGLHGLNRNTYILTNVV
jgi:hypothetical protein